MMKKIALCALLLGGGAAFAQTTQPQQPQQPPPPPMMQRMRHHEMMCGQMAGQADITVENTKDGAIIRFKARDPAQVARVQQLVHMMHECMESAGPPPR